MNRYRFDEKVHLHLLDEKPLTGCSSISEVLSKPLTWWAAGKAVESLGWVHATPTINGKKIKTPKLDRIKAALPVFEKIKSMEDVQGYIDLLDLAYKAHSVKLKESAQDGIDLHSLLEGFVKDFMGSINPLSGYPKQIQPFVDWANENVHKFLWSEAHCYSEELWTGGICDFGCELNDGRICVGDFKSAKAAYTSHFLQDCGYAMMIKENGLFDKDGNRIGDKYSADTLIVVPFGADPIIPIEKPFANYTEGFRHCLGIYRFLKQGEKE